jgi:hypothetical protein
MVAGAPEFLDWLARWYDALPVVSLTDMFPQPERGAILVEDLLIGFCREGALASPRIDALVPGAVRIIERARAAGVPRVVSSQDAHTPDTPEFEAFPPHCIRGTREADLVPEIAALQAQGAFTVIEKNSLSTSVTPAFERWLENNDDITHYLVIGDCTDLCIYQLSMFVRLWANATNRQDRTVVVAASVVDTYDLPVAAANGALPHPGDLLHVLFLYHMALNGIHVVQAINS